MPGILQNLRTMMKRGMQTRTQVSSAQGLPPIRRAGTAAAYRRAVALLLMMQMILWAGVPGIAVAGRGVWLSALGLIPAGLGVWAVSRGVWYQQKPQDTGASRSVSGATRRPWELTLLLPCALLDAVWLLHALLSVLACLMPSYPAGILRVVIPCLLTLGVWLGRRNGAAYGISLWRWTLPLMAVWVLVPSLRVQGVEQLFPLLGRGWRATAQGLLPGLGCLWVIGLLFLLPDCGVPVPSLRRKKTAGTVACVLLPLALCCLMAVIAAACAAWLMHGTAGQQLLLPGRSGSMTLGGLWALFCLLGLMIAFAATQMATAKLSLRLWPRCPGWLPVLLVTLPAAVLLWVWPEQLPHWLMQLLPWRIVLWAASAGWAGIRKAGGKGNGRR